MLIDQSFLKLPYLFPLNNSQVKNLKNTFYFWEKNLGFKFEMNHLQLYYDLQKTV